MSIHYERLSSLDNSFLALESRTTHMHVGAVTILDAASFATENGGIDIGRLRAFIESKLYMIPRYRQRLARVPIERFPVWVDDDHFGIHYHIRHIALPRPGTEEQLKQLAGRLMSQQLDRSKPMWEMVIVEGLDGLILAKVPENGCAYAAAATPPVAAVGSVTAIAARTGVISRRAARTA